ncbi:MAG: 23S rRNA (uracil(1939)-C(5))-methyltransferase RlmD [Myxococcota bacterium]
MSKRAKAMVGRVLEVPVSSLDDHGQGVGPADGRTVAVHGALPGDVVKARVTWASAASAWTRAELLEVLRPSGERVHNPCAHAPRCPGCPLMPLSPDAQLREKGLRLRRALDDAGLQDLHFDDVIPAPQNHGYRNRAKYVVACTRNTVTLGAYAPGTHDVLPTDQCRVTAPAITEAIQALRSLIAPELVGELRYVVARCNRAGEVLGTLVVRRRGAVDALAQAWVTTSPRVLGVVEHFNDSPGDNLLSTAPDAERTLQGHAELTELFSGVPVSVPSTAFTQLHADAAEQLCTTVAQLVQPLAGRHVMDAYCGLGAFAFALKDAASVLGIDDNPASIHAANDAAAHAGLGHLRFLVGDAAGHMAQWQHGQRPDLVVVDPPRKGLSDEAMRALQALAPEQLVYVACEPRSLARDLTTLRAAGWQVRALQPFDLFPQTPEVETVALLSSR